MWTEDNLTINVDGQVYDTFQILREGTTSSYDNLLVVWISDVNEHSGQYGCTVRNSFGSAMQETTFLGNVICSFVLKLLIYLSPEVKTIDLSVS